MFACTSALHALPLCLCVLTLRRTHPLQCSQSLLASQGSTLCRTDTYIHTHIQTGSEDGALAERLICCHFEVTGTTQLLCIITHMLYIRTVHDTENLTFFRGIPWLFRAGGRGSSVRAGADLPRRRAQIFRADSV